MSATIKKVTIHGYRSIRDLEDFDLRNINILIGPNGAGKSNFVSFFRLLRELVEQRLQLAVARQGGADALLYLGPKITSQIKARLLFGDNGYQFSLFPSTDNRLIFGSEEALYTGAKWTNATSRFLGSGHSEAQLRDKKDSPGATSSKGTPHYTYLGISSWVVYHFQDTGPFSGVRLQGQINDNESLRPSAENLAAFLFRIRETHPESYARIRDAVRLAAPFFDDFKLRPVPTNPEKIQLEWLQCNSDYPFLASQLSDGTIRFICLATALLQPNLPRTVLFDEPELGLHPYALSLLGGMIHKAVAPFGVPLNQVIVSTQSAQLLNEFEPEDIVVVERADGQSVFNRLDSSQLSDWLGEYTLGELWQKNLLGGRPGIDPASVPALESKG